MDRQKIKNNFVKQFNYKKHGFYDFVEFDSDYIGFSVKKRFKEQKNNLTSLISLYISKTDESIKDSKIPVRGSATYGEKTNDGIKIRDNENIIFNEPLDIYTSKTDYYYNIGEEKFYIKNKEVPADAVLNNLYNDHIKITLPFFGFWLRIKVYFWRKIVNNLFEKLSIIFSKLLYIISGEIYKYNHIDFLVEHRMNRPPEMKDEPEIESKDNNTIDFYGYKTSLWSIVVYCLFHFIIFLFCIFYNYYPKQIIYIVKYNFITLIYVIISLFFLDVVLKKTLKFTIKNLSKISFYASSKSISV